MLCRNSERERQEGEAGRRPRFAALDQSPIEPGEKQAHLAYVAIIWFRAVSLFSLAESDEVPEELSSLIQEISPPSQPVVDLSAQFDALREFLPLLDSILASLKQDVYPKLSRDI